MSLPWAPAVLLWPRQQGQWLLQSEPGSHRSWPPVGSSGVSKPTQTAEKAWAPAPSGQPLGTAHLCHCQRSLLGESVVIEVQDAEFAVMLDCWSQRRHAWIADTILGHVDFLQAADELKRNTGDHSTSNSCISDMRNWPFWQHSLIYQYKQHTQSIQNKAGWEVLTWTALARAEAPSFSKRFLPATNTLSLSAAPVAVACLWHSIRASAKICTIQSAAVISHGPCSLTCWELAVLGLFTFPPPTPMPQLLSFSCLKVWQERLFNSRSIPFTPSGPKALSLRSSSVSRTCAHINASPRHLWPQHR